MKIPTPGIHPEDEISDRPLTEVQEQKVSSQRS